MEIEILPTINIRTYYLKTNVSSISYISDTYNKVHYVIKGIFSDLLDIIATTKNYNIAKEFAIKLNIENELDFFLCELEKNNIIKTNTDFSQNTKKYIQYKINEDDKLFYDFKKMKSNFLILNNFLDFIYLEMNYACNLNCKHCCNPKNLNEYYINFVNAKNIIDEAYDLGINEVCLTGGECTINKDFLKVAKYIRERHLGLSILTNGQKLYDDKYLFEELVNIRPTYLKFSIYSMNPNIHDYITGVKGSLKKTVSVIKQLKERNINVVISFFQMSYNRGCFSDVEKFAIETGVSIAQPDTMFHYNQENNNLESKINEEEIKDFYFKNVNYFSTRNQKLTEKAENSIICSAGKDRLSINPKLDITPCIYFNYVFENYNNVSLKYVIEKIVPKFQEKFTVKDLKNCNKHEYCKYCQYCPMVASFGTDFLAGSEVLCEDARAYYNAYLEHKKINDI